ncbi:hypothetical protein DFH08DRAFT_944851 [Mycena albidolilacea]|uniref:Uncharacterized protein n=1 Tax=Mycena albidolilacea TaxID=1033008 RepID=A0AAD6Z3A8_9AGAR|nr:hypothetical protein DFH08DRAFT_944851 [Mycena albidolilacea]
MFVDIKGKSITGDFSLTGIRWTTKGNLTFTFHHDEKFTSAGAMKLTPTIWAFIRPQFKLPENHPGPRMDHGGHWHTVVIHAVPIVPVSVPSMHLGTGLMLFGRRLPDPPSYLRKSASIRLSYVWQSDMISRTLPILPHPTPKPIDNKEGRAEGQWGWGWGWGWDAAREADQRAVDTATRVVGAAACRAVDGKRRVGAPPLLPSPPTPLSPNNSSNAPTGMRKIRRRLRPRHPTDPHAVPNPRNLAGCKRALRGAEEVLPCTRRVGGRGEGYAGELEANEKRKRKGGGRGERADKGKERAQGWRKTGRQRRGEARQRGRRQGREGEGKEDGAGKRRGDKRGTEEQERWDKARRKEREGGTEERNEGVGQGEEEGKGGRDRGTKRGDGNAREKGRGRWEGGRDEKGGMGRDEKDGPRRGEKEGRAEGKGGEGRGTDARDNTEGREGEGRKDARRKREGGRGEEGERETRGEQRRDETRREEVIEGWARGGRRQNARGETRDASSPDEECAQPIGRDSRNDTTHGTKHTGPVTTSRPIPSQPYPQPTKPKQKARLTSKTVTPSARYTPTSLGRPPPSPSASKVIMMSVTLVEGDSAEGVGGGVAGVWWHGWAAETMGRSGAEAGVLRIKVGAGVGHGGIR